MMDLNCQIYIIKKQKKINNNSPYSFYINKINNRLVLKLKDGYRLELQTPERMILFGTTKKLIDKTKNGENVPIPEIVEVVLVQCDLTDNQYQQIFEVLYTLQLNKYYAYLINVKPSNLMILET